MASPSESEFEASDKGGEGVRLRLRDVTTLMPSSSLVTSCSESLRSDSASSLMATAESTNGDAVLPALRRIGRPVLELYETAGEDWPGLER